MTQPEKKVQKEIVECVERLENLMTKSKYSAGVIAIETLGGFEGQMLQSVFHTERHPVNHFQMAAPDVLVEAMEAKNSTNIKFMEATVLQAAFIFLKNHPDKAKEFIKNLNKITK